MSMQRDFTPRQERILSDSEGESTYIGGLATIDLASQEMPLAHLNESDNRSNHVVMQREEMLEIAENFRKYAGKFQEYTEADYAVLSMISAASQAFFCHEGKFKYQTEFSNLDYFREYRLLPSFAGFDGIEIDTYALRDVFRHLYIEDSPSRRAGLVEIFGKLDFMFTDFTGYGESYIYPISFNDEGFDVYMVYQISASCKTYGICDFVKVFSDGFTPMHVDDVRLTLVKELLLYDSLFDHYALSWAEYCKEEENLYPVEVQACTAGPIMIPDPITVKEDIPDIPIIDEVPDAFKKAFGDSMPDFKDPKVLVTIVEKIALQYAAIYGKHNVFRLISQALVFYKGTGSISIDAFVRLKPFLESMYEKSKELSLDKAVELLKLAVNNWKAFIRNEGARSLWNLLSLGCTYVLQPLFFDKIDGTTLGNIIGHLDNLIFKNDLVGSIVKTMHYITNGLTVLVRSGFKDWTGFSECEEQIASFAAAVFELETRTAAYQKGETCDSEMNYLLARDLQNTLARLNQIKSTLPKQDQLKVTAYINTVVNLTNKFNSFVKNSSVRPAPYPVSFISETSTSKTYQMQLVASALCAFHGVPSGPDFEYWMNLADKFMSGWRNCVTCGFADDMANELPDWAQQALSSFLIGNLNNSPQPLLAANAHEKGTWYNRMKFFIMSTNSKSLNLDVFSTYVSTQMRRLPFQIYTQVKKEFRKVNSDGTDSPAIDYAKVRQVYSEEEIPNAWEYIVYRTEIYKEDNYIENNVKPFWWRPMVRDKDNHWRLVVHEDEELGKLEYIDVYTLIKFLRKDSIAHFKAQDQVMETKEKLVSLQWCPECCRPVDSCCCGVEETKHDESSDISDLSNENVHDVVNQSLLGVVRENREKVLSSIIDNLWAQSDSLEAYDAVHSFMRILKLGQEGFKAIKLKISVFFNEYVSDVLSELLLKFYSYLQDSGMLEASYWIPAQLEGGAFGATMRMYDKKHVFLGLLNHVRYKLVQTGNVFKDMSESYNKLMTSDNSWMCTSQSVTSHTVGSFSCDSNEIQSPDKVYYTKKYLDYVDRRPKVKEKKYDLQSSIYLSALEESKRARMKKLELHSVLRDEAVPFVFLSAVIGYAMPKYMAQLRTIYKVNRNIYTTVAQSLDMNEVEEMTYNELRDSAPYKQRQERMLDPIPGAFNMRASEVENRFDSNLVHIRNDKTGAETSGLFLCDNVLMITQHFFLSNSGYQWTYTRKNIVKANVPGNACRSSIIDKSVHVHISGKDQCCVFFPSDNFKDLTCLFPEDYSTTARNGRLSFRGKDGQVRRIEATHLKYKTMLSSDKDTNKCPWHFKGYEYFCDNFDGLCGAVLVDTSRKNSSILAIHVGGREENGYSIACSILREEAVSCISSLNQQPVEQQSSPVVIRQSTVISSPGFHYKSPVFTSGDNQMKVRPIGVVAVSGSITSDMVYPATRDDIHLVFNIAKDDQWFSAPIHGINNDDKRYGTKQCLKNLGLARGAMNPTAVAFAKDDYLRSIFQRLESQKQYFTDMLRPLDDYEVVNGTDNTFMNGMPMNTAAGLEFGGQKKDHATQKEDGSYVFNDNIMENFHFKDKRIRNNVRINQILSAYDKVEGLQAIDVAKGKARKFFGAQLVDQMLIRKYTLCLQRFFCTQAETTESAVGTNPQGPRWTEIFNYMFNTHGFKHTNRVIGLDFSKFDLNVCPRVYEAALDICEEILKWSGEFGEKDIVAFRVLRKELTNAYVTFDSDFCNLLHVILSGINLTSIVGCIVNSLYYRIAFYEIYKDQPNVLSGGFKKVCRLLTYGDDSLANVSRTFPEFNAINIVEVWARHGLKATSCHKHEKITRYTTLDKVDFIKRKFRWDSQFGCWVAPLQFTSIIKPLTIMHKPTTLSYEAQMGDNFDNALFEMKFWGKQRYNDFRQKIIPILCKHHLLAHVSLIPYSFENMVDMWKLKYDLAETREALAVDVFRTTNQYPVMVQSKPGTEAKQIVTFLEANDQEEEANIDISPLGGRTMPSNVTDLAEFMSRPVEIDSFDWSVVSDQEIDPWSAFLSNKRVANRISNYHLMRGNLCIKILINGNSFFYGCMMVAYRPYIKENDASDVGTDAAMNLVVKSQLPHVLLDPTTSTGGAMKFPFLWHFDYIDLTTSDMNQLGKLYYNTLNALKFANNAVLTNVQIVTYAWMENLEIHAPTQANVFNITAQSKEEETETSKPVSQTATSIAKAAGAFTQLPLVGKYARAIEMGASSVSRIAGAFGYCRPGNLKEPERFLPRPVSSLCTTNSTDSPLKLSFDVRQETSIDTSLYGIGSKDMMSIKAIAQRPGFWVTATWLVADPVDHVVLSCLVTPMACRSNGNRRAVTPIAGATCPFRYWKGTIIYTVQVVCSSYHKGRLAVVYDPVKAQASPETNVAFTEIVDISKTRVFEISIANHMPQHWLRHSDFQNQGIAYALAQPAGQTDNGVLTFHVHNPLTVSNYSATSDSTVEINVWIRAGPDFEVCAPNDQFNKYSVLCQSQEGETLGQSLTQPTSSIDHPAEDDKRDDIMYMGESIDSLRSLFKRYMPYRVIGFNETALAGTTAIYSRLPMFNLIRGAPLDAANNPTTGIDVVDPTTKYNYVGQSYVTWFKVAFVGERGGVRYKYAPINQRPEGAIHVFRDNSEVDYISKEVQIAIENNSQKNMVRNIVELGFTKYLNGGEFTTVAVNDTLEFEIPHYSNYKFHPARKMSSSGGIQPDGDPNPAFGVLISRVDNTQRPYGVLYSAAAEDYTLLFFVGFPILVEGDPPA